MCPSLSSSYHHSKLDNRRRRQGIALSRDATRHQWKLPPRLDLWRQWPRSQERRAIHFCILAPSSSIRALSLEAVATRECRLTPRPPVRSNRQLDLMPTPSAAAHLHQSNTAGHAAWQSVVDRLWASPTQMASEIGNSVHALPQCHAPNNQPGVCDEWPRPQLLPRPPRPFLSAGDSCACATSRRQ